MDNTTAITPTNESTMLVFGSQANFENAQRMAIALASSTMVPIQYQKAKTTEAVANCIIALEMANRIGMSPLMVMQNLYVVHGNVGWSSKFLIASLNTCGRFTPIQYEQVDANTDNWRCRAYATDKTTGAIVYGAWVSLDMAKEEGWTTKSGSKWLTMPELMLQYRAAAFFQRVYAPEISMGMQTVEELHDTAIEVPYEDVTDTYKEQVEEELKTIDEVNRALLQGRITKTEADELKKKIEQEKKVDGLISILDEAEQK